MKTHNFIYKTLSVFALLCCFQAVSWGQKVYGDKYETEGGITEFEVEYSSSSPNNTWTNPSRSCDGVEANQYASYESSRNSEGSLTFDLGNGDKSAIMRLSIISVTSAYRPTSVTIETSNNEIYNFTTVQRDVDLHFSNNTDEIEIDGSDLRRYVRLTFTFPYVEGRWGGSYQGRIYEVNFYQERPVAVIRHKDAKWFDLRDQYNHPEQSVGTFDYDQPRFDPIMSSATEGIQAAHTYIDTIYVHKGTRVDISIPTKQTTDVASASSSNTYQRWYSYRTDGTFETENHGEDNNAVWDLLTPLNSGTFYRLENGYVGYPIGDSFMGASFYYPTNSEFEKMFPDASNNPNIDNDWYVVACDVSSYTDFTESFTSKGNTETDRNSCASEFRQNYYEPTLSVRVIFYIVGVDERIYSQDEAGRQKEENWNNGHGRLTDSRYQGGGIGDDDLYLEEYDITFPTEHLARWTDEVLALSKDARSYAIPGMSKDVDTDDIELTVTLASASDRSLKLLTDNLQGEERIIQFRGSGDSGRWRVDDGTTATITVTKQVGPQGPIYNIARFNLTFDERSVPLTQTQVANIKDGDTNEYRSPTWMEKNLEKLTELTFDFDETVADDYGQANYRHYFIYPLSWNTCSYAFFDGSPLGDFIGQAKYLSPSRWFAQWDYYALADDYVGYGESAGTSYDDGYVTARPTEGLGKPEGTYFLYVDASDRPGILARLPFNEKLCPGSELFVTAWVKSAGQGINNRGQVSDDAAVLFTVMGVDSLDNGQITYTPIYRHSSSQLTTTTWLDGSTPGTGRNTNDWYQIYFSFLNNDENAQGYDSYILQVENNCASSSGGDYYLDDIKVYLAKPSALVTQKEFTCTNERTRMNIELDWDRLMSRLGTEGAERDNGIDFCFIDETTYNREYDEYLAQHGGAGAGAGVIDAAKEHALDESIVEIGDGNVINTRIMSMYLKNTFDDNYDYGMVHNGDTLYFAFEAQEHFGKPYFYKEGDETDPEGRRLTVDFYSVLSPNRPYRMLIIPMMFADDGSTVAATTADFATQIGDPCAIETQFWVESSTIIKANGEVVDPSTDFCVGQVFNFSAQLRVPVADGQEEDYIIVDNGVYFDWFFGTEDEFVANNTQFGADVSLESALTGFRAAYPDATELSETATPWSNDPITAPTGDQVYFTEAEYRIIEHYLNAEAPQGGINTRLVLHRPNLDITLLEDGLELVVKPIQTMVPPSESGLSKDQWTQVCWSYVPLILTVSDEAPQLRAGFNTVNYPASDFNPALRIGLNQIRTAETEPLRIDLRGAKIVTDGAAYLGPITSQEDADNVYLIDTDDPAYESILTGDDTNRDRFNQPVIGHIEELFAEEYVPGSQYDDHMNITFNLGKQTWNGKDFQFAPKEGYSYTFAVYFEEKSRGQDEVYNTCYGSFPMTMKVVPEYLVWQGTEKDNWNNDGMWKRADKSELHKPAADVYVTNEANTTDNGFVPMLFSNVVMPAGSKAELYMAGYTGGGAAWAGSSNRPEGMGDPTENIQYDLMVYDGDPENTGAELTTQRFRVNICRDIHFAPGAQMLHAEQLIYNKAWADVELPTKAWTLVSSPLRGVYAGDWYTAKTGTQADKEYFEDVTFASTADDRLNPAVYQRSWNDGATIVEDNGTQAVSFETVWSAAYNDASVPYQAGEGFSVKAADVQGGSGTLVFRLPKADTSYDVTTGGTITRVDTDNLLVSGLVDRSTPTNYVEADDITVTLNASQDGKYLLVGNPFMAPLNIADFMEANTANLTGQYWTVNDGAAGTAAGGVDVEGEHWIDNGIATVEPYGAFLVEKTDAGASNEVRFTADMQTFTTVTGGTTADAALRITADNESGSCAAMLAYTDNAANAYVAREDAKLMRDILGNGGGEPYVYTVAGDVAASVNRVKNTGQVPLGLFAGDGDVTQLTFTGVGALAEPTLYDAETDTETPLTEGFTLSVSGPSHGRYFIRAKGSGTTGIADVTADGAGGGVSVYSPEKGTVVVSSGAGITAVDVYSVGGALTASERGVDSTACTVCGIDSGVAIVRVTTQAGSVTRKITVK